MARRVAHEIKNPLTPIALSADRILRHLDRARPDPASVEIVRIRGSHLWIGRDLSYLVNELATLGSFSFLQPQPANINGIVESALSMFNGRVDEIHMRTLF